MNRATSNFTDGRRANRWPSAWLGILVLAAIVAATISHLSPKSRTVIPPIESLHAVDHGDAAFANHPGFTAGGSLAASMTSIECESDPGVQEELVRTLVSSRALPEIPAALQQLAADTNRISLELAAR
ncbi:MAG TPA: hypothetical protein VK327_07265, partial [Candidatus Paceibacterota bacterium]|nr:hypothetical protein [Candidatus Paceibacterota bacterium]